MVMNNDNRSNESDSPVSFEDTSIAFQNKSDRDLLLSNIIFGLTKNPFLVKFLTWAAKFTLSIGLPVKPLIKATVFKNGQNHRELLTGKKVLFSDLIFFNDNKFFVVRD